MRILITSALPYVNNVPHLGNLVCIVSADVYSRYLKLKKIDSIYVLGTDEHGTTTETKAMLEGKTPREICDKYAKIHKEVYDWFLTEPDCWGRSSSKENLEISQQIFLRLKENGYIIEDVVEQAYCNKCKKFLSDRFVNGICPYCGYQDARGDQCEKCGKLLDPKELNEPRCAICSDTPIFKTSNHLFIDLPKLAPKLKTWIKKHEKEWSENASTMTQAWLKEGLKPRCITRDLKWGIPVPMKGYENKVFYSWFDAPIAYISITKENKKDWETWWKNPEEVQLVQFMGKDNIPFHTILFPASLIGTKDKWTLLNKISVNEYLNYESGMFSKSRGVGVFGDDAMKTGILPDVYRYYLMVNRPEKQDTEFNWEDLKKKNNNELVANLGNLVNRTATFITRFYDGMVPESKTKTNKFMAGWQKTIPEIDRLYSEIEIKKAIKAIMDFSSTGNKYFQEQEPWKAMKEDPKKANETIFILSNFCKDLAILIQPFMPGIAKEIKELFQIKKLQWSDLGELTIKPGTKLEPVKPLFEKISDEQAAAFKEKFSGQQKPAVEEKETKQKQESAKENKTKEQSVGTFNKLNLKVAEIKEAKPHPNADKLCILKIDLGKEQRQIVAGIRAYFKPEELIGKKIIVVTNLEPANLRGEESNGMLLASLSGNTLKLLEAQKSKLGENVFIDGSVPNEKQITFNEFKEIRFILKNKHVLVDNKPLKTSKEIIILDQPDGAEIR